MASGDQKSGKKPELKVIADDEPVTRLGTTKPETGVPRKKALLHRSHENEAILKSVIDSDGDSEAADVEPIAIATEEEPGSLNQPTADPIRIPPIVFILTGAAFVVLLALGIFMAMGGRTDTREVLLERSREKVKSSEEERQEGKQMVQNLTEVLDKYASAKTVEEKMAYIRQPERVAALMQDYYKSHELESLTGLKLLSQTTLPIQKRSFVVVTASFDDESKRNFLVEVGFDGMVTVDWESEICYQSMEPGEYVREKPTESLAFRVFAQPDNFYAFEFRDEEKYQCLRLSFRDSDEILYGYIDRNTKDAGVLFKFFQQNRRLGSAGPQPLLLKTHFPKDPQSERSVYIDRVVATRWAKIDEFDE